jgi:hypothetical protein
LIVCVVLVDTQAEGEFMVGYIKFNAFLNPYPFYHAKHVLAGLMASLGPVNVSRVSKSLKNRKEPLHSSSSAQIFVSTSMIRTQ